MRVPTAVSPKLPVTSTTKLLPVGLAATVKNVPVKSVPAPAMWHAELANSPDGAEVTVHDVLVLLSCPPLPIRTKRVVPGVAVATDAPPGDVLKMRVGLASTVNVAEPVAPLLLVTVTTYAWCAAAPELTVNDPVTVPELLMLQLGAVMNGPSGELLRVQVVSWPGNPVP